MKINQKEFEEACARHIAPTWVKIAFKYFSKSTTQENIKVSNTITIILVSVFGAGFVATVTKLPRAVRGALTITFCAILTPLVLLLLAAVWNNNARIRRICAELGITIEEYNTYVNSINK